MPLVLPRILADRTARFPESSYGASRVTLVLADGRRIRDVLLSGGTEIVKIGSRDVAALADLDFALGDIEEVISEWSSPTAPRASIADSPPNQALERTDSAE